MTWSFIKDEVRYDMALNMLVARSDTASPFSGEVNYDIFVNDFSNTCNGQFTYYYSLQS